MKGAPVANGNDKWWSVVKWNYQIFNISLLRCTVTVMEILVWWWILSSVLLSPACHRSRSINLLHKLHACYRPTACVLYNAVGPWMCGGEMWTYKWPTVVLCTAARAAFHGFTQLIEWGTQTNDRGDKVWEKLMCKGKVILHAVHFSHKRQGKNINMSLSVYHSLQWQPCSCWFFIVNENKRCPVL